MWLFTFVVQWLRRYPGRSGGPTKAFQVKQNLNVNTLNRLSLVRPVRLNCFTGMIGNRCTAMLLS